jgi:hypothetical protein
MLDQRIHIVILLITMICSPLGRAQESRQQEGQQDGKPIEAVDLAVHADVTEQSQSAGGGSRSNAALPFESTKWGAIRQGDSKNLPLSSVPNTHRKTPQLDKGDMLREPASDLSLRPAKSSVPANPHASPILGVQSMGTQVKPDLMVEEASQVGVAKYSGPFKDLRLGKKQKIENKQRQASAGAMGIGPRGRAPRLDSLKGKRSRSIFSPRSVQRSD